MKNFQFSLRLLPLIFAVLLVVAAITLRVFPRPQASDVVDLPVDASGSTGADYTNFYQPAISQLLPRLVGRTVRVMRVGGRREVLHDGALSAEQAAELRSFFVATQPYSGDVQGSPLTGEVVQSVKWLKAQRGANKVMIFPTDGLEDNIAAANMKLPKDFAAGIQAIILYPRLDNPRLVEVLRTGGAQVTVARTPIEAQRAIDLAVTGVTPQVTRLRSFAWVLMGLALVVGLLLGVRAERLTYEPDVDLEELPPMPEPVVAKLQPLAVNLTANAAVQRQPLPPVRKKLRCDDGNGQRGGSLVVGRQGATGADLLLPLNLLGRESAILVEITPVDTNRVRVRNLGAVDVLAGGRRLKSNDQTECDTDEDLRVGPRVKLKIDMQPA